MVQDFIFQAFNYLTFSLFLVFGYQAIVNILIYRQHILNPGLLLPHIGLCLLSAFYSGLSFLVVQGFSLKTNLLLIMLIWMTGSVITFFYIRTLRAFLNDDSKFLSKVSLLPLISAIGGGLAVILWFYFDINILLNPQTPIKEFQNIFMAKIGGFNPHGFIKGLSLLIIGPSIYSLVYFVRIINKSVVPNRLLLAGILLSSFVTINDVTISIIDSLYLAPLMFMANILEILRISYANQVELGKRLSAVTFDLIQSNKLVGAGSYYSTLAHEVSNPVSAAKGYFAMFRDQIKQEKWTPKMKQYETALIKQFDQILVLLSNVKNFTKPSLMDPPREISFSKMLNDSLDTVHIKAYYAGVKIEINMPDTSCKILCQPDQLIQVFTNIFNNSIESITELEEKWIKVKSRVENKTLTISITDSGPGIPSDVQGRIWESRFTTKKDFGNGLGLSICKTIILNHKGKIHLNTDSSNTEFIIELPCITSLVEQ